MFVFLQNKNVCEYKTILACACMFMCMFILLNLNVIYVQNNNFKCYITITFLEVFYSSYQKLKISHIDMLYIYKLLPKKKKEKVTLKTKIKRKIMRFIKVDDCFKWQRLDGVITLTIIYCFKLFYFQV